MKKELAAVNTSMKKRIPKTINESHIKRPTISDYVWLLFCLYSPKRTRKSDNNERISNY